MDSEQLLERFKRMYCPEGYVGNNDCPYDFECSDIRRVDCWETCMKKYDLLVSDDPIYPYKHWNYSFDFKLKSDR